jgi:hypothetical protein
MQKRVDYDLYYVQHWSFWLDIVIIWRTIKVLFGDKTTTKNHKKHQKSVRNQWSPTLFLSLIYDCFSFDLPFTPGQFNPACF